MSSLLEQAIIDAGQLREAALKSAEAVVAEKYSDEIKSIMNELLEEADEDLGQEEIPSEEPGEEAPAGAEQDVPPAALDGETACPCPDEVEGETEEAEYELDLDQLARMPVADDTVQGSQEELAGEIAGEEEEDPFLQESEEEITLDLQEDIDIDLTTEDILSIIEEMEINVDAGGTPSGWLGTPEPIKRDQIDQNLAALKDTEEGEEKLELIKKIEELEEANSHLTGQSQEFKNLAEKLAEKLEETNRNNAKLLYINKTLGSTSLNERQKETIVEAISKANTAEEAKVIFETLQNTVGSSSKRERLPESLSEAVNRKAPAMLVSHPRRAPQDNNNGMGSFAERMRKLAGIT